MIFQSTRPSRASTGCRYGCGWDIWISIHKALAGLDGYKVLDDEELYQFQSTRPSRASTRAKTPKTQTADISIHKALAGLDEIWTERLLKLRISIHKALAGLDGK